MEQPIELPSPNQPVAEITADEKNWGVIAHLSAFVALLGVFSFLGPLVVWLFKKDESPYVAEHARQALNFNLSILLYSLVGPVLLIVVAVVTLGLGLLVIIPALLVVLVWLLWQVVKAAMVASRGEYFDYPLTIEFVK